MINTRGKNSEDEHILNNILEFLLNRESEVRPWYFPGSGKCSGLGVKDLTLSPGCCICSPIPGGVCVLVFSSVQWR